MHDSSTDPFGARRVGRRQADRPTVNNGRAGGARPSCGSARPIQVDRIEQVAVAALHDYQRNARTHSPKQVAQLAASIREFGFVNPVIADGAGSVVAGHGRLAAARELELATVPVIRLEHLTPERIRAYRLADNRLAELAGWDHELLAVELEELGALDLDFEIEITGFETAAIDLLIDGKGKPAKADPADEVPESSGPR